MRAFCQKTPKLNGKKKEKDAVRKALIFLEGDKIVENLLRKKAVSDFYFQYF